MDRLSAMRRASQAGFAVVFLLLPVFDILRYDVAERTLYLFGSPWGLGLAEGFYRDPSVGSAEVALQVVLHAVLPWLMVLSIFPLLGFLLGRAFCGWLCPEGALFELMDRISLRVFGRRDFLVREIPQERTQRGKRAVYAAMGLLGLLAIPPLVGVFLSGYFITPSRIWHEVVSLEPSPGLRAGVVGVSAYMLITSVLVRHRLCKYVCAAGLMQMLLGWVSPAALRVRFDRQNFSKCTDCRGCEKVCFMGVKPRASLRDINCVNCGACISACNRELGGEGLFQYRFGEELTETEPLAGGHTARAPQGS